jgi:hypothetical protein
MIKGIFAAFLLLCGIANLKSEAAGALGWILIIAGCTLLIYQLSGPTKPKKHSKNGGGGASYSDVDGGGDSGSSGGDGGGGGGD